jgi:transcriptional regulator GlxA family with amidase domain
MPDIGLFASPQFQLLDLTEPLCAFQHAGVSPGTSAYRTKVLSGAGGPMHCNVGVALETLPIAGAKLVTTDLR